MRPPGIRQYKREWLLNDQVWTLKFVRKIDKNIHGECDPETHEMRIAFGMNRNETLKTVVHEMIHAMGFAWEIEDLEKERLVKRLEGPVTKFVLDNF